MQSLDIAVINQAQSWLQQGPVWLCTVLSTYGSSPRSPGAMLVANASGNFCGSLSGGCVEDDFLSRLAAGEYRQMSQVIRYGDGGLTPDRPLPCGGVLDILIEYLPLPEVQNLHYLELLSHALAGGYSLLKKIEIPHSCYSLTPTTYKSCTQVAYEGGKIIMTVAAPPRIVIAGLSAVALYCADFAVSLGFETVVCENRPEVLENMANDLNRDAVLKKEFPANYLEKTGCHANTAVVALTHDPRMDDLTLMEAVNTSAFYIGAMGSAKNSRNRLKRLQEFGDLSEEDVKRIHAPIGMMIGSKTPAEIALAVMVDIVKAKNFMP